VKGPIVLFAKTCGLGLPADSGDSAGNPRVHPMKGGIE